MTTILLTGAGFSRNWGGWLGAEVFEYLLGCIELEREGYTRGILWQCKYRGQGFEEALSILQERYNHQRDEGSRHALDFFQRALKEMFRQMDAGMFSADFVRSNDDQPIHHFLESFDAIFTLNQDLLLEHHYFGKVGQRGQLAGKWSGWQLPGTQIVHRVPPDDEASRATAKRMPNLSNLSIDRNLQPYFKLHGSHNWFKDGAGESLLVMGGGKSAAIQSNELLRWYSSIFIDYLSRGHTRLVVIGYSFNDAHINQMILDAAKAKHLRIFIIDPLGVDVLDKNDIRAPIKTKPALLEALEGNIYGGSRRLLSQIFGGDKVELAKVMKFVQVSR